MSGMIERLSRAICAVIGHRWYGTKWEPSYEGWRRRKDCHRCGRTDVQITFHGGKPLDVW